MTRRTWQAGFGSQIKAPRIRPMSNVPLQSVEIRRLLSLLSTPLTRHWCIPLGELRSLLDWTDCPDYMPVDYNRRLDTYCIGRPVLSSLNLQAESTCYFFPQKKKKKKNNSITVIYYFYYYSYCRKSQVQINILYTQKKKDNFNSKNADPGIIAQQLWRSIGVTGMLLT